MSTQLRFQDKFSVESLRKIFTENISNSGSTGVDNLTPNTFAENLDEQIEIISRKVQSGTYKFTKYKLKLIPKGRGKAPREISIPTVRDRIALRALSEFLSSTFRESISIDLPQNVIKDVKNIISQGGYSGYIKLDVSNFYPSIVHSNLLSTIRKRVKDENILETIMYALSSPTVDSKATKSERNVSGVPQGLAISNILAAIYMINIDRWLNEMAGIAYFRYVDDVLIFCDEKSSAEIASKVITRFKRIGLVVHKPSPGSEKSVIANISEPFSYLGYKFDGSLVTAKNGTVERLKDSIAAIFTAYKHSKRQNVEFLIWRLDIRITGCVFENKAKGWLFFFSEINDESLLHKIDIYIEKLASRFGVTERIKKFSRAFKEIQHNRYDSKYIPNFDSYNYEQQYRLLEKYFPNDVVGKQLTQSQVEYLFKRRIRKQTKDLLVDIKDFKS